MKFFSVHNACPGFFCCCIFLLLLPLLCAYNFFSSGEFPRKERSQNILRVKVTSSVFLCFSLVFFFFTSTSAKRLTTATCPRKFFWPPAQASRALDYICTHVESSAASKTTQVSSPAQPPLRHSSLTCVWSRVCVCGRARLGACSSAISVQ